MLIGGRGNLVNRVATLGKKYGIVKGKFDHKRLNEGLFEALDDSVTSHLRPLLLLSWSEKEYDHHGIKRIEEIYFNNAHTKQFLEDRYRLVQLANEYITKVEPWKKYKDELKKQEAIEDLEFLLWVVKKLGLLAAPFLTNGFAKLQKILGNKQISAINSAVNGGGKGFAEAFDAQEFEVNLEPLIMYEKKE
jgi:methionyl-tRNA synthetase